MPLQRYRPSRNYGNALRDWSNLCPHGLFRLPHGMWQQSKWTDGGSNFEHIEMDLVDRPIPYVDRPFAFPVTYHD